MTWACRLLGLALVVTAVPPAFAHRSLTPRGLDVRLRSEGVSVVIRHQLDELESIALIDRFDRDASGRLSEVEESAASAWLGDRTRREIAMTAGTTPVVFGVTSSGLARPERDGDESDVHVSFVVVLEGPWPSPCPCALELRDSRLGDPASIPVEVVAETGRLQEGSGAAHLEVDRPTWHGSFATD